MFQFVLFYLHYETGQKHAYHTLSTNE